MPGVLCRAEDRLDVDGSHGGAATPAPQPPGAGTTAPIAGSTTGESLDLEIMHFGRLCKTIRTLADPTNDQQLVAMLTPLFGGSFTAPVSPAPDLPSRTASDYQDPIDDTNQSYRDLMDSLTADDEMLLGSVPAPIAPPAEMQPINYPTDPGDIDDMIGDAYKNASGRCPPSVDSDGGFHDRCVAAAASPGFEQKGLEVIKGFNQLAELWGSSRPRTWRHCLARLRTICRVRGRACGVRA